MRTVTRSFTVLTLALAMVTMVAVSSAEAGTQVRWRFAQSRVDHGAGVVVEYSTAHLPVGARVLLQRRFGTAQVYKTVATLKKGSGRTATVTAPAMGRYGYRILVTSRTGHVLRPPAAPCGSTAMWR